MISMAALERAHPALRERRQREVLEQAAADCAEQLAIDPAHPSALHLCSLMASRKGQTEFALACVRRAVALAPANAEFLGDLGDQLARAGDKAAAVDAYRRALTAAPHDASLHFGLGRTLGGAGKHDDAAAAYGEGLRLDPDNANAHLEFGDLQLVRQRVADAESHYESALMLAPGLAEGHERLGRLHLRASAWADARVRFERGLQIQPGHAGLHTGVGEALMRLGSFAEAAAHFKQALIFTARHLPAARHLVFALEVLGRRDDLPGAWFTLGEALERAGRIDEALAAYRKTVSLKAGSLKGRLGAGFIHLRRGQSRHALGLFDAVLALRPDHVAAHQAAGWAAALHGDLQRKWRATTWLERHTPGRRRYFEQPHWDGAPLDGRTILLWADDVSGEMVQMLRYVESVHARGGRVIVECHRALLPLVREMPWVERALARKTPLPRFDTHAHLAALPGLLRTSLATVPNRRPYMRIEPALIAGVRARFPPSESITIGLVWSTDHHNPEARRRSVPLAAFAPLADRPGVQAASMR